MFQSKVETLNPILIYKNLHAKKYLNCECNIPSMAAIHFVNAFTTPLSKQIPEWIHLFEQLFAIDSDFAIIRKIFLANLLLNP